MNTQNKSSGTICWKDKDIKFEQMGLSPLYETFRLWLEVQLLMQFICDHYCKFPIWRKDEPFAQYLIEEET